MNKEQIQDFENSITQLIGIKIVARFRVQSIGTNSTFGCGSEDLLKRCADYLHLPEEERQYDISKFDADPTDCLTSLLSKTRN